MQYHKLGKTDIRVSAVAMGCWAIVGDSTWGPQDEALAIQTIQSALDQGINFFDTAEMYGNGYSEELVGRALAGKRGLAVISSKVSSHHLAPADLVQACEDSLRRLQTDYLDLYQIHWPSRTVPLADSLNTLHKLQSQGKIRAIGVSNFATQDLEDLIALGGCASNQLPYSLLARAIEHEILPKCVRHGIDVLCYSPLAQGLLTGKFTAAAEVPDGRARTRHFAGTRAQARHGQIGCEAETFAAIARIRDLAQSLGEPMAALSLAWILHQRGIASVLAGARSPQQIAQNAHAAEISLSPETLRVLDEATAPVKGCLGPNPDLWQAESRMK